MLSTGKAGSEHVEDGGVDRSFELDSAVESFDPPHLGLNRGQAIELRPNELANLGPLDELELAPGK